MEPNSRVSSLMYNSNIILVNKLRAWLGDAH